jgi:hypothetical protein
VAINQRRDKHYNGQKKKRARRTMVYKTLHIKLKIGLHELNIFYVYVYGLMRIKIYTQTWLNSGAAQVSALSEYSKIKH